MTSRSIVVLALAAFAAAGCGSQVVGEDAADVQSTDATDAVNSTDVVRDVPTPPVDAGRVPHNHRADSNACQGAPAPGNCSFGMGPPNACQHDTECTAGSNGRCVLEGGGIAFCQCSYDTCTSDSQCTMGGPCACHGSAFLTGGNACVPGNCHVDADCGAGGYCSPSQGEASCGGLGGYYCHTPNDTCVDDSDCPGGTTGPQQCIHRATTGRWECGPILLCG